MTYTHTKSVFTIRYEKPYRALIREVCIIELRNINLNTVGRVANGHDSIDHCVLILGCRTKDAHEDDAGNGEDLTQKLHGCGDLGGEAELERGVEFERSRMGIQQGGLASYTKRLGDLPEGFCKGVKFDVHGRERNGGRTLYRIVAKQSGDPSTSNSRVIWRADTGGGCTGKFSAVLFVSVHGKSAYEGLWYHKDPSGGRMEHGAWKANSVKVDITTISPAYEGRPPNINR